MKYGDEDGILFACLIEGIDGHQSKLKLQLFMPKIYSEMIKINIQHLNVRVCHPKETS